MPDAKRDIPMLALVQRLLADPQHRVLGELLVEDRADNTGDMPLAIEHRTHDHAMTRVALVDAERRLRFQPLQLVREMPRRRSELDRLDLGLRGRQPLSSVGCDNRPFHRVCVVANREIRARARQRILHHVGPERGGVGCLSGHRQRARRRLAVIRLDLRGHLVEGVPHPVPLRRDARLLQRAQKPVLHP
jgi:hypothetical protein